MIRHNRLQNKVAGSEATLPVCAVAAALLWWLPQCQYSMRAALGLVLCALTAYVIMETNTQQHLIRIRTRMMSCVWIVLAASLSFLHPLGEPSVAAAFLAVSYLLLFRCYQLTKPQTLVFHAFLMLGMGSFCAPVMLPMAVLYYIYLIAFLRAITWRAFWAGILGLAVPYWSYAVWCLATGDLPAFANRLTEMAACSVPSLEAIAALPQTWLVSMSVIGLITLVSLIHCLRNNYDDKIRTRMMLYIYVMQTLLLFAFLLLQPAHYQTTMALIVVSAAPLIAHFFALTGSIVSNLFFIFSLLLVAAMATLNLWMTSFSFC